MNGEVRLDCSGGVATLTIANRDKRNALDDATRLALRDALLQAQANDGVRALVLTGSGSTFCAGGELSSMSTTDHDVIRKRMGELHDIARLVIDGDKPVVAAVEGYAYGSGLSLVAAADHVVAASDARFCAAFGRVGLVGDVALAWSLARRVGQGVAAEILLFAEEIAAVRAADVGLVDRLVEPGTALAAAAEAAGRLAKRAPLALAAARRLLGATSRGLDGFLSQELESQLMLLGTSDFTEGRSAFFDRRQPIFEGR